MLTHLLPIVLEGYYAKLRFTLGRLHSMWQIWALGHLSGGREFRSPPSQAESRNWLRLGHFSPALPSDGSPLSVPLEIGHEFLAVGEYEAGR